MKKKKFTTWSASNELLCASDNLKDCVNAIVDSDCIIIETGSNRGWRVKTLQQEPHGHFTLLDLAQIEIPPA